MKQEREGEKKKGVDKEKRDEMKEREKRSKEI